MPELLQPPQASDDPGLVHLFLLARVEDCLVARVRGEYRNLVLKEIADYVFEQAARLKSRAIVFDSTEMTGTITTLDRYEMGQRLAERMARATDCKQYIASVPEYHLEPKDLTLTVAHNRGLAIQVATSFEQALIMANLGITAEELQVSLGTFPNTVP